MKRETIRGDEAGRGQRAAGDAGKAPRLRLDLSLKQMFMIGAIVADFLLTCQPEQACLLKLTTLRRLSAEHIGCGVEVRDGSGGAAGGRCDAGRELNGPGPSGRLDYRLRHAGRTDGAG